MIDEPILSIQIFTEPIEHSDFYRADSERADVERSDIEVKVADSIDEPTLEV